MNQAVSDVRNCETQKTVNTRYIYGMSLCGKEKRRVKTEPQIATVVGLWSFDARSRDHCLLTCLNL